MTTLGIVALLGATATGILPNGNFEKDLASWSASGNAGVWRVEKGAGRPHGPGQPPTAALVWERKPGTKHTHDWLGNAVTVKPGMVYRITGWITVDKLEGNKDRPGFSIGMGTAEGYPKWCCGTRVGLNRFDELDLDGWRKVTNVTPPVPGGMDRMIIALAVDDDAAGRVRFDDVVIEPIGDRTIDQICCMAPGRAASAGPVLFSASVCVDLTAHPLATLRPKLKWTGGERAMTFTGTDFVSCDVEATAFPMGRNVVTLSLETADGKVLATDTIDFTRTAPDTAVRKTKFDEHRRLRVNGKLTYPLGIYWHYQDNDKEDAYDLLAQTPFNYVISYDKDLKDTTCLDRFHKRGIGVISSLAHCYGWLQYRPQGVTDDASAARHATNVINRIKNHPAHWGWYLVDEPSMDKIPSILEQYRRAKALDPDHICGVVTWTPNDARMLSQCADFFGVDTYPIGALGASEIEKYLPNLSEITRECAISREQTKGRVPLWQVPQAFSWAPDYHNNPAYWWMRVPTREEFVSQTWQEIASGADGFCWFIFTTVYQEWKKGNRGMFYDLCAAMFDVSRLSPALLSSETPPALSGMDGELTARAFLHEGKAYVVACNLTWNRRAATLTLAGRWQKPWTEVGAPVRVEKSAAGAAETKLALDLPPVGVSVVRLEPQGK